MIDNDSRLFCLVKTRTPDKRSRDAAELRTGLGKDRLNLASQRRKWCARERVLSVRARIGETSIRRLMREARCHFYTAVEALKFSAKEVKDMLTLLFKAPQRFLQSVSGGYFRALLARGTNREGGDTDARAPYGGGGEIGDVNAGGSFETSFLFSEPNSQQAVTNDSVTVEQSETAIKKAGEAKRSPNHSEQRSMSDTNPKTVSWKPSYPGEKPPGNPFTKAAGSEKDEVKKETETGTGYFNREPRPSSTIKVRGQLPVTRVQKDPTAVAMPDEFRERFKKFSQSFGTSKKWTEPIDTSPADEEWFAKHTPKIQNVINGR